MKLWEFGACAWTSWVLYGCHEQSSLALAAAHEMSLCFTDARDDPEVGVVILTGGVGGVFREIPLGLPACHYREDCFLLRHIS